MKQIIICAAGPSLAKTDFELIRASGIAVMTINNAWKMMPEALYHYAGDLDWWDNYYHECKSTGQRFTWSPEAAAKYGLKIVKRKEGRGLCVRPGYVHHAGNSGCQAINHAYHLGFTKMILVGFDMSRKNGAHFDGDHKPGMLNAPPRHIPYWKKHMGWLARDLKREKITVLNSSEETELACFPLVSLEKALAL